MKPMRIGVVLACVAVAGCAGAGRQADVGLKPITSTTSNEESVERSRARAHTELAAGYFELGNMSVALEEVKEALRSDPNYPPAHSIAGLIYGALKQDGLAEESFKRALTANPNDSYTNHNYGEFLCQRKREDEGIRHFVAATRNPLYPDIHSSYTNAGVCARRKGDMASAENYFLLALKSRANHPQALYNMADLAYGRGDYEASKTYLGRLTQLVQPNAEILWLGVRVERRLGDRNSEASYALQLRNRFPASKEAKALAAGEN
jgi:type IV pilus assembly protein PilF